MKPISKQFSPESCIESQISMEIVYWNAKMLGLVNERTLEFVKLPLEGDGTPGPVIRFALHNSHSLH